MNGTIVIGGGHNGLIAAFYLARAGLRPLVIERRPVVGGGAITEEIHPGFRAPTLSHDASLLSRAIATEMQLARHGLELLESPVSVFAPGDDGRALLLYDDVRRSAEGIGRFSRHDAEAYPAYRESLDRISAVLTSVLSEPPPDIDRPDAAALWRLLKTGRQFRALGRRDAYRLLRWVPMAVADLLHEWFETDLLGATLAARGVSGTMLGPWSAGSSLVLLMHEAHRAGAIRSQARGGPGAVTGALAAAAAAAGATFRTGTGVSRILVKEERAAGVELESGEVLAAGMIVSALDPKTTFLRLMDPFDLTPDFAGRMRNYRSAGTMAKVNLALSGLPRFTALGVGGGGVERDALSGRIHIGPGMDALESAFDHAKYGAYSAEPWLDVAIPSILDDSLAPPGAHVASVYVHYAPYALRGDWNTARPELTAAVMRVLERYAPGFGRLVLETSTITPVDLETHHGFFGGHPFHGELAADQLFAMRPLLGYGNYTSPVQGLYLCGAGTHPGGFMTGQSGRLAAARILKDMKK